jgi:phage shock protein PspC (stress-responsive transcriptional regulator)
MKTTVSISTIKLNQNRIPLIILVAALATAFPDYALSGNQPQAVRQVNKTLQDLRRENQVIQRVQVNDTLEQEPVPENEVQFMANQTYIARSAVNKIADVDRPTYNNMTNDLKTVYSPSDIKMLPETFIQTGLNPANQLVYKIGFESKLPLEYLHDSRQFEGSIKFILLPESPTNEYKLNVPVLIEVVSDFISYIEPVTKEINHLSIPLTEVRFRAQDLADSAQVKIITQSNPQGYKTFLKVKPAIELTTNRVNLQGLGVQKIPVTLKILGTTAKDSIFVTFNPEKGTVDPQSVFVHSNRPTVVNLRSEGLGKTTLSASSVFNSNELTFNYNFPWVFILMSLIGGTIGGLAKYYSKREKLSLLNYIIKGILFGFMGSVIYYVLGYSFIAFKVSDIFNEFAVLGFSALVAYFGIKTPKETAVADA